MRVTPTECSLGGLLKRRKDEGREIFISRGEEKIMCVQERERERGRGGVQIDRKSHCDSKQSQITMVCVSHGTSSSGSADTIVCADAPPSSRTR